LARHLVAVLGAAHPIDLVRSPQELGQHGIAPVVEVAADIRHARVVLVHLDAMMLCSAWPRARSMLYE
jgi:hypothetical protein